MKFEHWAGLFLFNTTFLIPIAKYWTWFYNFNTTIDIIMRLSILNSLLWIATALVSLLNYKESWENSPYWNTKSYNYLIKIFIWVFVITLLTKIFF